MHPPVALNRRIFGSLVVLTLSLVPLALKAQEDGGTTLTDGGGQEILESIAVTEQPHAPFSLTLSTEWARPLTNGGSYTVANTRPLRRDSAGRIYQERWLLAPKGSGIASQMAWIQIEDPVAALYYECNARRHLCEMHDLPRSAARHYDPDRYKSGPLRNGKGTFLHEDLGAQSFAGLPVHEYRDTTTLNAGVMGNDLPMVTVRQFRYCPELGLNLTSVLEAPQVGRQTFTASEVSTAEPDPAFFQPPVGYTVKDERKPKAPASAVP